MSRRLIRLRPVLRRFRVSEGDDIVASEGDNHRSILDALSLRLRQLLPDVPLIRGKRHRPSGLKPDLLVEHPDGRTWAFEVVYGNHGPGHLRDNHARYAAAGVHDHWIVWEGLGPGRAHRLRAPLTQSRLWSAMETPERVQLTQLQRRILETQSGPTRWLLTFAVDVPEVEGPWSPYLALHLIGLEVFQVVDWQGEEAVTVTSEWIPLSRLR